MRRPSSYSSTYTCVHGRRRTDWRGRAGFTLIEVLVSALILGLIAGGAATAFVGSIDGASTVRLRSDAQALAQQDENRLRGLNINQLSNLNHTLAAVSMDGASFTVKESAAYVSDSAGAPSCTNPSADYLQTTSTVTWAGMGSAQPVAVSSVLTPTVGSLDPTHGTLAVSVTNSSSGGLAGMNVNITGPVSDSAQTATGGCAMFGNLPVGTYGVSVAPTSGTYVDALSGQAITPSSPDVATPAATVNAGTTAASPTAFQMDAAGTVTFSFTDLFPAGASPNPAPTATAPAVSLLNTSMTSPSYRVCSAADASCPPVGHLDPTYPVAAWGGTGGQVVATPVYPYTYSAWAGFCQNNEPSKFGATDGSATVAAGGTGTATLTLPAMVVRLYTGTSTATPGTEMTTLPAGAHLVITDTGCAMSYRGYTSTPPTLANGQVALPLTAVQAGANDTGLLEYPGMPYGSYTVCYDNGTTSYTASALTNTGNGELINLYAGSATAAGVCQ
jgi:prepilin-type N-terminal cleavage/methylation domain-containing protein